MNNTDVCGYGFCTWEILNVLLKPLHSKLLDMNPDAALYPLYAVSSAESRDRDDDLSSHFIDRA